MGQYTFEDIIRAFIVAFISIAFIFVTRMVYNSFVSDNNDDILYQLDKRNKELEHQKWELEIDHLKKMYNND